MSIVEVISPDYIKVMSGVGLGIVGTLAVTWVRQVDIAHAQQRITAFLREEDEQDAAFLAEHRARFALPAAPSADPHVTGELVAVMPHDVPTSDDPGTADEDDVHSDGFPWWGWLLMPLVILAVAVLLPFWVLWLAGEWTVGKAQQVRAAWRRRRDERHMVGSGEQATDVDPFAELLAAEPEPQPEPVTIVHVNHRYRKPGDTGMFPLVKVVGDKRAGRHRAEPEMPAINVPAQRTGDADA